MSTAPAGTGWSSLRNAFIRHGLGRQPNYPPSRPPPQSLRMVADLSVRYPLVSSAVPQVPPSCGPAAHPKALRCPVGLCSVPDPHSNFCSICWSSGDLARPGCGPADRGAAGAVRGAARRRPGHPPPAGRRGRAVPPRRRHQDLEPHAARAAVPARGVPPTLRRLPRPPTDPSHRRIRTATVRCVARSLEHERPHPYQGSAPGLVSAGSHLRPA
jgi:hypothetical protein